MDTIVAFERTFGKHNQDNDYFGYSVYRHTKHAIHWQILSFSGRGKAGQQRSRQKDDRNQYDGFFKRADELRRYASDNETRSKNRPQNILSTFLPSRYIQDGFLISFHELSKIAERFNENVGRSEWQKCIYFGEGSDSSGENSVKVAMTSHENIMAERNTTPKDNNGRPNTTDV